MRAKKQISAQQKAKIKIALARVESSWSRSGGQKRHPTKVKKG